MAAGRAGQIVNVWCRFKSQYIVGLEDLENINFLSHNRPLLRPGLVLRFIKMTTADVGLVYSNWGHFAKA